MHIFFFESILTLVTQFINVYPTCAGIGGPFRSDQLCGARAHEPDGVLLTHAAFHTPRVQRLAVKQRDVTTNHHRPMIDHRTRTVHQHEVIKKNQHADFNQQGLLNNSPLLKQPYLPPIIDYHTAANMRYPSTPNKHLPAVNQHLTTMDRPLPPRQQHSITIIQHSPSKNRPFPNTNLSLYQPITTKQSQSMNQSLLTTDQHSGTTNQHPYLPPLPPYSLQPILKQRPEPYPYAYSSIVNLNTALNSQTEDPISLYKLNQREFSSTWGPKKAKSEENNRKKRVKFASTWGPIHSFNGEYATINPKKLRSRYVRPGVFVRTHF